MNLDSFLTSIEQQAGRIW